MLLKLIGNVLGYGITILDTMTRSKPMKRSAEHQMQVDAQTAGMTLYQFESCPFCIKVRRAIHHLGLNIQTLDTMNDTQARSALQQGGGKTQVPCLRLQEQGKEDIWLYESNDIIGYLQERFG